MKAKVSKEARELGETGERMVPSLHSGTLIYAEHVTRYSAALNIVKDKIILDIASGSGYGSSILAQSAKKVYGVDVDGGAVAYAQKHYGAKNIEFKVGDGESIPLADNSVDVVITYETIEHIENYNNFVAEISRVLKDDGIAIISTPNDLEFAEGNHYHLHEFTHTELLGLVKRYFKNIDSYFQGTWKYVALGKKEDLESESFTGVPTINYSPLDPSKYLYFFLICSNRNITEKIKPIAALGEHFSDRYYIGVEMNNEQNLKNYETVVSDLKNKLEDVSRQNNDLQHAVKEIHSSRAYKLARLLSNAKRKLSK